MTKQQDVSEFIVVPPLSAREQVLASKERFVDYLQRQFPRFAFTLSGLCPVEMEGEHFLLIPIMNYQSPDGAVRMCRPVPNYIAAEIQQACYAFEVDPRRFAA